MKTELYATLRERIVKVVPEILELKFGCRFDDESKLISIRYPFAMNSQVSVLKSDGAQIDYETSGVVPNHSKILGRDITLADCLRAIGTGIKELMSASVQGNGAAFVVKVGDGHMVWNLALPLHLQEDAVGEWLMTVIK